MSAPSPLRPPAGPRRTRFARSALTAVVVAASAAGALAQAQLGSPAPDFTLLGNDGQMHTLSDGFGSTVQFLFMVGYA
ncbi:MAG TPA: hypothetical protein PLL30_09520 [Candidatus Krumholzibacteria bacterium]|nr:hypothetical protein [Candidatus Krumholzibacteria bacterium]HPD72001.1 hypothetical protein [Candidatus Krumholzibacteria bacterium]HRY41066.1 hypothetical protein [Candidatus Krumholzibacteria bacterium]